MRIEGDDHSRPPVRSSVFEGAFDDGPVPEMNAIEHSNGQKERSGDLRQFFDGVKRFQAA